MNNYNHIGDMRNGYQQVPEHPQYPSQMNANQFNTFPLIMPNVYPQPQIAVYQSPPMYQGAVYPMASGQIPSMPLNPQMTPFPAAMSQAPAPQPQNPPPVRTHPPQKNILSIKDPQTNQEINILGAVQQGVKAPESQLPTRPSEAHHPVVIRTPPPSRGNASSPATSIKDSSSTQSSSSVVPDVELFNAKDERPEFTVNSEDDIPSKSNDIEKLSQEDEVSKSSDKTTDTDVDAVSESADEGSVNSDRILERVESAGSVQRYNREQLISIRSSCDFSQLPQIPMSVVSVGAKPIPQGRRTNHKVKRIINFNTDVVLDEVENAYRPSALRSDDVQSDRTKELSKQLSIILNRLLDSNVSEVLEDIKKLNVKGEDEAAILADAIVNKASKSDKFMNAFAKLCDCTIRTLKMTHFKEKLMKNISDNCSTPLTVYVERINKEIDEKIQNSTDDKVKKMIEEDRDTVVKKKCDLYFGIMKFYSHLYLFGLVSDKVFTESLKPFSKPKSQQDVVAMINCLRICGEVLDKRMRDFVDLCMSNLEKSKRTLQMESHVPHKIDDLVDRRRHGWKSVEHHNVPQVSTMRRPESSKDTGVRQMQAVTMQRKSSATKPPAVRIGDSKGLIDTKKLAVTTTASRSNYLGPGSHYDWSQGSKAQPRQPRSGTASESDTGKESRASSVSNVKRDSGHQDNSKVNNNLTASQAIEDIQANFDVFSNSNYNLTLCEKEKPKFVEQLLVDAMEGRADTRKRTVAILSYFFTKQQLSAENMVSGFKALAEFSDDLDCPKLGEYFGELASCLIVPKSVNFANVVTVVNMLPSEKDKREGLAQCVKVASKHADQKEVCVAVLKEISKGLPWGGEKTFEDPAFLKRYEIEFLVTAAPKSTGVVSGSSSGAPAATRPVRQWGETAPPSDDLTKVDKLLKEKNLKELLSLCSQQGKVKSPEKYLRAVFSHGQKLRRKEMEALVPVIKTLISSDSEHDAIFVLQQATSTDGFRTWLQTLLQQKILTAQSVKTYTQDKRAVSENQRIAQEIIGKSV